MKVAYLIPLIVFSASFFSTAKADVPPEPGFKRVTVNLVVEAQDDFPDHRFFLRSGSQIVEVSLKKGSREVLSPIGGGSFYRSGSFIAIPKASIKDLPDPPGSSDLNKLIESINDSKVGGVIQLVNHSFAREVREAEVKKVKDVVYSIERIEDGPKANLVAGTTAEEPGFQGDGVSFGITDVSKSLTPVGWFMVIGGVFMSLAVITLGLWLFLRSRKAVTS